MHNKMVTADISDRSDALDGTKWTETVRENWTDSKSDDMGRAEYGHLLCWLQALQHSA